MGQPQNQIKGLSERAFNLVVDFATFNAYLQRTRLH